MEKRKAFIYSWTCPLTSKVVYVGKTSVSIRDRMRSHRREAFRKNNTPKHYWLAEILIKGLEPIVAELQQCLSEESGRFECEWIDYFTNQGCILLNEAVGGGGNPGIGRIKWTPEIESRLGTVHDPIIAAELGCNRGTVAYRRRVLGIKRCPIPQSKPQEIILPQSVIDRISKEPDYQIASSIGVSKFVIRKYRQRHNMPSYAELTGNDGRAGAHNKIGKKYNLSPEIISQLGRIPDYMVAEKAGIEKMAITRLRRSLKITAKRAPKGAMALNTYANSVSLCNAVFNTSCPL